MITHLHVIGFLLVLLALVHIGFPRYFQWRTELASLSLMNRQMMHIHMFFIALMVLMMGILCLTSAQELTSTVFGKRIALFLGVFWSIRLMVQLFGYSIRLWKGKRFETVVHVVFTLFWSYASVVFFWTVWG
ncbi:MAG: hypothetical protein JST45_06780 [Bacteroidetes bacterium]|nr:hypothetical protein [Bacteroidota bacterium]